MKLENAGRRSRAQRRTRRRMAFARRSAQRSRSFSPYQPQNLERSKQRKIASAEDTSAAEAAATDLETTLKDQNASQEILREKVQALSEGDDAEFGQALHEQAQQAEAAQADSSGEDTVNGSGTTANAGTSGETVDAEFSETPPNGASGGASNGADSNGASKGETRDAL